MLESFALLMLAGGCAAERYHPAPIVPAQTAAAFHARTLADPGLRAYAQQVLGGSFPQWPPPTWSYRDLSVAALYFNPSLEEARARVAESHAQILTARARPNPSLGLTPGIPSPYLLTLDLSFPIETAGKRGYRVQTARSLDLAARLELARTAWSIESSVRAALVDHLLSTRTLALLRAEADVRTEQVGLLRTISEAGEISRQELAAAEIELSRAHTAVGDAAEHAVESQAALAAAVGVPLAALEGIRLAWSDMDTPPGADALPREEIERDAVLNRLDVRAALARYAAAESSLELELAKQYPDISIGPGYTYEEKHSYFTVGLSATLPVFDHNAGPIAEAEARRQKAQAEFVETQAQAIARSERALALYGAAVAQLAEANRFAELQSGRREATRKSVQAGELGRLDLADADIEHSVAARARLQALGQVQRALGDLEDAIERPLTPGDALASTGDLDAR